jgi:hypothetical protein
MAANPASWKDQGLRATPQDEALAWIDRSRANRRGMVDSTVAGFLSGVFLALGTNILVGLALSDSWSTQQISSGCFLFGGLCLVLGSAPLLRLGALADQLRSAPRDASREIISRVILAHQPQTINDDLCDRFQTEVEASVADLLKKSYRATRVRVLVLLVPAILLLPAAVGIRLVHSVQNQTAPAAVKTDAQKTAQPTPAPREAPLPQSGPDVPPKSAAPESAAPSSQRQPTSTPKTSSTKTQPLKQYLSKPPGATWAYNSLELNSDGTNTSQEHS